MGRRGVGGGGTPSQGEQTLKQAYFQECPRSTMHVQVSTDARIYAIHSTYRSSLRPSSLLKPRHPLLNVARAEWLNILHGNMVWEPRGQRAWQQSLGGVASAHPGLSALHHAQAKTSIAERGACRMAKYLARKHAWEPQGQRAWQQGLGGVASAHPGLSALHHQAKTSTAERGACRMAKYLARPGASAPGPPM